VTAGRAAARLAIASLLSVAAAAACGRKGPDVAPLPESNHSYELSIARDDGRDAGGAARPAARPAAPAPARGAPGGELHLADEPLLTEKALAPELRALVEGAHAHPAVGSLEAAGCDMALVMTARNYNRLVDLQHKKAMPVQATDPREMVVWCSARGTATTPPPDCAALAPVFARVARPKHSFLVFSSFGNPPFSPRCAGTHDRKGKALGGEGPGYPSSSRL
jgi:hypothetical protein